MGYVWWSGGEHTFCFVFEAIVDSTQRDIPRQLLLVNGAAIKTRPILPARLTTVKMSSGYLEQPKLQAISGCQHGTIWCDLRLLLFRRDIDRLVVPEHSSEARRSCWQKLLAKVTAHDLVRTFSSSQLRSNIMGAVQHSLSEPVHQSLSRGKSALRKGLVVGKVSVCSRCKF